MELKYLIDTNVIIDHFESRLPVGGTDLMNQIIDTTTLVSIVTKIEVLGFKTLAPYDQLLLSFMKDATILKLSDEIAETSIAIRKNRKIKLADAVIAATALEHELILLTNNTKDFKNIVGLNLVNPYHL